MNARFVACSVLVFALAGCKRSTPAVDAGSAVTVAPVADAAEIVDAGSPDAEGPPDAGPTPPLAEGKHEFSGTIDGIKIKMTITRTGGLVRGNYSYVTIGAPITLEGTVEPDGAVKLAEQVGGKVTGSFTLRTILLGLVGPWRDSAGKKSRWVILTRPSPRAEEARKCLDALDCSAEELARRWRASDDAKEPGMECDVFVDGIQVPKDPKRARACYEYRAPWMRCEGSSPDSPIAILATMRIDGYGGAVDIPGARKLLEGCFADVTVQGVREHADQKERDPSTAAVDFCKDIGGTTITGNECAMRGQERDRTRSLIALKKTASEFDADTKSALVEATRAFDTYVQARGTNTFHFYSGGTMRTMAALADQKESIQHRATDLKGLAKFSAPVVTPAQLDEAQRTRTQRCRSPRKDDAEQARLFREAEEAFAKYEEAEIAFYVRAFGAAQGEERVRTATQLRLWKRRAQECPVTRLDGP